jgi:D-methionine transport system permease protein
MNTVDLLIHLLPIETLKTLYMVFMATAAAFFLGLPMGIVLFLTGKGGVFSKRRFYKPLATLVDVARSFPFAILLVALIPLTRWLVGTSLGTNAAIVPLSIAAAPFFARLAESSFRGINKELIDASILMGSTPWQLIKKVLLPETFPLLIENVTTTGINLIGYTAMAGLVGGGGLGKVAIDYGYYRFNTPVMVVTVVILILLVQLLQTIGNFFSKKIRNKRGDSFHEIS